MSCHVVYTLCGDSASPSVFPDLLLVLDLAHLGKRLITVADGNRRIIALDLCGKQPLLILLLQLLFLQIQPQSVDPRPVHNPADRIVQLVHIADLADPVLLLRFPGSQPSALVNLRRLVGTADKKDFLYFPVAAIGKIHCLRLLVTGQIIEIPVDGKGIIFVSRFSFWFSGKHHRHLLIH